MIIVYNFENYKEFYNICSMFFCGIELFYYKIMVVLEYYILLQLDNIVQFIYFINRLGLFFIINKLYICIVLYFILFFLVIRKIIYRCMINCIIL